MPKRMLALAVAALALMGCRVDVTPPKPSSVREIKNRTLVRIDELDKAIAENRVHPQQVKYLAASLNYLRGHMRATGVGTPEQFQALDEALDALARIGGFGGIMMPEDWRPGDDNAPPPPPPIIETGPIKEVLPQIRQLLQTVPDSDLRPDWSKEQK